MWRKFVNPMMLWLLRSPLHFLVSGQIMLISVTGRKSGRTYITPVDYRRDGDAVLAVTSHKYAWWKNLLGGGDARMWIAGREVTGRATVSEESSVVLDTLHRMYPGHNVENVAPGCVALRIEMGR
jgi:deazaflavin-dependent oxidoreductase (nitroreductase family)